MKIIATDINGLFLLESEAKIDQRGLFERYFCSHELSKVGFNENIMQINHSETAQKGTIRGMHYQLPPFVETKIVRCLRGSVFDVAVDLRKNSPTFLQWQGVILSAENRMAIYIQQGFAHGFQTLEDNAELLYLHTAEYVPSSERAVRYNDPILKIKWPLELTSISIKDQGHPLLTVSFKGIEL